MRDLPRRREPVAVEALKADKVPERKRQLHIIRSTDQGLVRFQANNGRSAILKECHIRPRRALAPTIKVATQRTKVSKSRKRTRKTVMARKGRKGLRHLASKRRWKQLGAVTLSKNLLSKSDRRKRKCRRKKKRNFRRAPKNLPWWRVNYRRLAIHWKIKASAIIQLTAGRSKRRNTRTSLDFK